MEKSNVTYTMFIGEKELIEALKMYVAASGGGNIKGEVSIKPDFKRESYPIGIYDCDYREVFQGLKITVVE